MTKQTSTKQKSKPTNTTIGVQVGHTLSDEFVQDVAKGISTILKAGFDTHAEQTTIQIAIESLAKVAKVENVTVCDSTISMGGSQNENN